MERRYFKNKKPISEKLIPFGFEYTDGIYRYSTEILEGQFSFELLVGEEGAVHTRLTDVSTGEEYILHRIAGSAGAFVGRIRAEYEQLLEAVSAQCFQKDVFKTPQAQELIRYVRKQYGCEAEYLWDKLPDNAIWRRADNGKWFGALLTVCRSSLGLSGEGTAEVLNLTANEEDVREIIDGISILPGYHMNKKYWYSIVLDGSVDTERICALIENSRCRVGGKKRSGSHV